MDTLAIAIAFVNELNDQLSACQKRLAALEEEHQKLSFMARIIHVPSARLTPQDKILYLSAIEIYPDLLSPDICLEIDFSVKALREAAGGASKNAAGNFMRAMAEAGAWRYASGAWNGEERLGSIKRQPAFLAPETIDLKSGRAKEEEEE